MPELAEIERLTERLTELRDAVIRAQTDESDIAKEQTKAESDVEQVRIRSERDQQRLDGGLVSAAKELENLQHEIASLARRQSALEDVVLEVMERRDAAQTQLNALNAERVQLETELSEVIARRDAAFTEIDTEVALTHPARAAAAGQIEADLLALYEKIRASSDGIGAAALYRSRCEGCHLTLTAGDLGRLREAPADEVVRCEECRRILVRTPESGL